MNKKYLGYSVYVDMDPNGGVVMTTWDGVSVTNRIVIDHFILAQLEEYIAATRRNHQPERNTE